VNGTRPAGRRNAATPPPDASAVPWEAPGWRRALQLALAALWLLDAVLQYQTFMFSQGFPRMLAATAAGNPAGVAGPVTGTTGPAVSAGTTPAPAAPRPVLCPRLAACCQIIMGVAMAYMLILML
jgi:hypothetical protein